MISDDISILFNREEKALRIGSGDALVATSATIRLLTSMFPTWTVAACSEYNVLMHSSRYNGWAESTFWPYT